MLSYIISSSESFLVISLLIICRTAVIWSQMSSWFVRETSLKTIFKVWVPKLRGINIKIIRLVLLRCFTEIFVVFSCPSGKSFNNYATQDCSVVFVILNCKWHHSPAVTFARYSLGGQSTWGGKATIVAICCKTYCLVGNISKMLEIHSLRVGTSTKELNTVLTWQFVVLERVLYVYFLK